MHHPRAEVRALAVHYLGRALLFEEFDTEEEGQDEERPPRPLPPDVLTELNDIAVSDPAFGPRFQARGVLREAGQPAPLDNPDGVYTFRVTLRWAKVSRTIELRSQQTLDDLHFAIRTRSLGQRSPVHLLHVGGRR